MTKTYMVMTNDDDDDQKEEKKRTTNLPWQMHFLDTPLITLTRYNHHHWDGPGGRPKTILPARLPAIFLPEGSRFSSLEPKRG
jgi:hypothetical protein